MTRAPFAIAVAQGLAYLLGDVTMTPLACAKRAALYAFNRCKRSTDSMYSLTRR